MYLIFKMKACWQKYLSSCSRKFYVLSYQFYMKLFVVILFWFSLRKLLSIFLKFTILLVAELQNDS